MDKIKYEVHFSKYVNKMFPDHWKFNTVEANTEEEAIQIVIANNSNQVNYILSCTPLNLYKGENQ